jgi:hypothetical protein
MTGHTTDTGTDEIGSNITSVSYEGKVKTTGTYNVAGKSVGSGLGNDDTTWEVTLGTTTKTSRTGTFTTNTQINNTGAANYCTTSATGTMDFTDVVIPTNNLGTSRPDAKITKLKNGTASQTMSASRSVTGYRDSWYYVGTDCTTEIDSDFIRTYGTPKNANTTNFGTITIPKGTKRVLIAVPGSHTIEKVVDEDGMGLAIHDINAAPPVISFETKTIAVKGANNFEAANYSVFVYENPNGVAATRYTFTIS